VTQGSVAGEGMKRAGVQYAALPYRVNGNARPEIMLVTSRETRRWIIPKGWPQKGKTPYQSAAREAFEECGVIGTIGRRSIGAFVYRKRLKTGDFIDCKVRVFAMEVKRQHKAWPERDERTVKWLPVGVAARRVKERQLQAIIRRWASARRMG
jgi:8-oxo-dGTP pyrophosphatase MutT (NUDIX family)